jgi:DNA-binding MarR family transcriptional regulator
MLGVTKLMAVVRLVRDQIFTELPLQQLYMLLLVIENPGINQQDFMDLLGVPAGTVSRNLSKLGSRIAEDRNGKPVETGYNLIQIYPDPADPKKNTVHLTKKGKEFADQLMKLLQNGPLTKSA